MKFEKVRIIDEEKLGKGIVNILLSKIHRPNEGDSLPVRNHGEYKNLGWFIGYAEEGEEFVITKDSEGAVVLLWVNK